MLDNSIFYLYKKIFDDLINNKYLVDETTPDEDEIVRKSRYGLKFQLFLLRNSLMIKNIFEKSELKTRDYEFKWQTYNINDSLKKITMESRSNFQPKYQKDSFYMIISEENKFILILGYIQSRVLNKRIGSFFKEFFPDLSITF
ncbi:MAG: hypothetical protein ACFFBP_11855 [Promethearchaeota archaeon]